MGYRLTLWPAHDEIQAFVRSSNTSAGPGLTLTQLEAAVASGDVHKIDTGFSFNCSITSITTYLKGTPLTFSAP